MKINKPWIIALTFFFTLIALTAVGYFAALGGSITSSKGSPGINTAAVSGLPVDYYRYAIPKETSKEMIPSWNVMQW